MRKNYIYIHVCCIKNYKDIFLYLINYIIESKLYDIIDEIRCCVLGKIDNDFFNIINRYSKIILYKLSINIKLYEIFTLNTILQDSMLEDFNVLYLHTKGVTKEIFNNKIKTWVEYMCYFNIYHYEKCIKFLNKYDTVGVNLQDRKHEKVHYAGNFWWSKSSYIKKLTTCKFNNYPDLPARCRYNSPEFWITEKKIGNYVGLWHSQCPHYQKEYNENNYKNKEIIPYFFIFNSKDKCLLDENDNDFEQLVSI